MSILRWLRESITHKPYRPCLEGCRHLSYAIVGWIGWRARHGVQWIRRQPRSVPLMPASCRHIVIVRPDRIGDVVLSTPALRALRMACPQSTLTVIASPVTAPLLQQLSSVDEVVVVPGDGMWDWWSARETLRALRQRHPELVIALEATWPAALLTWWLGRQHRVGYDVYGMGWLFTHAVPYPFLQRKAHQVEVNLHLLAAIGIAVPPAVPPKERVALEVVVTTSAKQAAEAWLKAHDCVGPTPLAMIHPGSRSRYTQWDPGRFGAVADRVTRETGSRVIVLCGPGEEPILQRMLAVMETTPTVAMNVPLETVIGLLARCCLFIGNATGTMHLASAVTPHVIAIIGGTHPHDCPERWGPWGAQHRAIHRPPIEVLGRDTWQWLGLEGLRHITPDDVMATARALLWPSRATTTGHE